MEPSATSTKTIGRPVHLESLPARSHAAVAKPNSAARSAMEAAASSLSTRASSRARSAAAADPLANCSGVTPARRNS